jgi:hypothetical protein
MSSDIINTFIVSITSVITCLLGLFIGRRDKDMPHIKEVRTRQLENLFTPLEKYFVFSLTTGAVPSIEFISSIIKENFELTPPAILNEFLVIKSNSNSGESDFWNMREMVSSFYNWTRKSLGYPYERSAIIKEFTQTFDPNSYIPIKPLLVVFIFGTVFAMVSANTLTSNALDIPLVLKNWSGYMSSVCMGLFLFLLGEIIIKHIRNR